VTLPVRVRTLAPGGAMLGVLGGGQLGRMFVHAAQVHGFRVAVLDPDAASPAGATADRHHCAAYTDAAALDALVSTCAAVTTEFENVPAGALRRIAATRPVAPAADAVEICQNRGLEKRCFAEAEVPCAPHALLASAADLAQPALGALLPGLLKTASLGYDGKGQIDVPRPADLPAAWSALGGVPCVLERRLPLRLEVSVIVARGHDGRTVQLPVQQNLHRNGILFVTQAPAPGVDPGTAARAVEHALRLANALDHVGVLCVEFFVLEDGSLVANEMAPRPHNSGHYSIDACDVSQFDLQVRTLAGLPLVEPRQHSAAVMINLLGDLWFGPDGRTPHAPDLAAPLALPGVRLHLYGKREPRAGRKMGHLTITATEPAAARVRALEAAALLGLPGF
jgi:5-(carboxyamino)imidazole ribonucleotide synthase